MRKLLCLIGALVMLVALMSSEAKAETSHEALLATDEIPRAFQGIDLAETAPISDAQAQEIRGAAWPALVPFLYLVGHYVAVYGPTVLEVKDFLENLYEASVSAVEIAAYYWYGVPPKNWQY